MNDIEKKDTGISGMFAPYDPDKFEGLLYFQPGELSPRMTDDQKRTLSDAMHELETAMVKVREAAYEVVERTESGKPRDMKGFMTHQNLDDAVHSVWENSSALAFELAFEE